MWNAILFVWFIFKKNKKTDVFQDLKAFFSYWWEFQVSCVDSKEEEWTLLQFSVSYDILKCVMEAKKGFLLTGKNECDMMHCNSFPFVLAPLRRSLCLFWRETHTKGLRTRSPTRLEEGRKVQEKTEELIKKGRREQLTWDSGPENDTVSRRRQWEDGGRAEKRVNRSQKDDC